MKIAQSIEWNSRGIIDMHEFTFRSQVLICPLIRKRRKVLQKERDDIFNNESVILIIVRDRVEKVLGAECNKRYDLSQLGFAFCR